MIETVTLSLLGGALLTEGVSFLYGQAGELLNRWRDRRAGNGTVAPEDADTAGPRRLTGPLDGPFDPTRVDMARLDGLADAIASERGALNAYAEGFRSVGPEDEQLLLAMARLRTLMESVYGQSLTFRGERDRPATGARVSVDVTLEDVYGEADIARIGTVESGDVDVVARAKDVKPDGKLTVARIDRIGGPAGGGPA
ncbi:hypothetical protein [Streptomyces sp. NPDC058985]|uniref:hypothetical protein n=1 Tax=Streptomyces sp. NPDC058985 TaxID=3346684 RepID=UPI00368EADC3